MFIDLNKASAVIKLVRKVLASLVEFSNVDNVAPCVIQQLMIFVTKRVVSKTDVDSTNPKNPEGNTQQ